MGNRYQMLQPQHKDFISKQHLFFVATAPLTESGHINVSPKGLDAFRVLSDNMVGYMDIIGSGNETSAHLLENRRITFMFCSFDSTRNILRLYGHGFTVLPGTEEWLKYSDHFKIVPSTRQLILAQIDLVQTSCGYGVPLYDFTGDRDIHFKWADKKGEDGLKQYLFEKNRFSLDGLPTKIGLNLKSENNNQDNIN